MNVLETMQLLLDWTPYLAAGFKINLIITGAAMVAGTLIGRAIAALRMRRFALWRLTGTTMTVLCRNIPSFVLMFYLAFMIPPEIVWAGEVMMVAPWIKAAIALTAPVIGFVSDQVFNTREVARHVARRRIFRAWVQYALIVFMATALASIIGADEIVGRANRMVLIVNEPGFLIATYSYVALWFVLTGIAFRFLSNLGFLAPDDGSGMPRNTGETADLGEP